MFIKTIKHIIMKYKFFLNIFKLSGVQKLSIVEHVTKSIESYWLKLMDHAITNLQKSPYWITITVALAI